MKNCYIAGPIGSQLESEYRPRFEAGAKEAVELGYCPILPIDLPHVHGRSWTEYMREDIQALVFCDAILMLDGWGQSKGACIEMYVAQSMGMLILWSGDAFNEKGLWEAQSDYVLHSLFDPDCRTPEHKPMMEELLFGIKESVLENIVEALEDNEDVTIHDCTDIKGLMAYLKDQDLAVASSPSKKGTFRIWPVLK